MPVPRLLFLILALVGPAAAARAQEDSDDPPICLSVAHPWHGSAADVRSIEAVPVPPGFSERFEGRCQGHLVPSSLLHWHLAFGSEASTAAAISYLRSYYRILPPPELYARAIERAWRAALPDLRHAATMAQPPGLGHSVRHRYMERRPAIQALRGLVAARHDLHFLADAYLRAGEEFGSLALLDQAELYTQALIESAAFLSPLEGRPPVAGLLYFNLDTHLSDALRMRVAVLRAHLTRTPADLAGAEAIVNEIERPLFRRLVDTAFGAENDFCDIDRGASQAEQIEAACRQDDDIHERTLSWSVNRAVLDEIAGSGEGRLTEEVVALIDRELRSGSARCCQISPEDDLLRLRLQKADRAARLFEADAGRPVAHGHWHEALAALRAAADLVPPSDQPARYRRIAEAWLRLWDRRTTLPASSNGRQPAAPAQFARYAAYLRRLLPDLPAIATAD